MPENESGTSRPGDGVERVSGSEDAGHGGTQRTTVVDTTLESTLDSVDQAETIVLDTATRLGFEEEDLHKIGMSVRESMVNAVVHGNKYNSRKKVYLKVDQDAESMAITIRDEGTGFDLASLPDPLAEENLLRQSGRGILLIQAFVDEFSVRKLDPNGTEVRIVKYLHRTE